MAKFPFLFCFGHGETGSFVRKIPLGNGRCDVEYIPLNAINPGTRLFIRDVPDTPDAIRSRQADNVVDYNLVLVYPTEAPLLREEEQHFVASNEAILKLQRSSQIKTAIADTKVRIAERGTKERFRELLKNIRSISALPKGEGYGGIIDRRAKGD